MASVGVRELKAHLSQCLKRVQAGERLIVTDRGKAVATLHPAAEAPSLAWVDAWVSGGAARWNGGKPTGLTPRVKRRGKPASRMVIEDRR